MHERDRAKSFTISVPRHMHERMSAHARRAGMTLSELVRAALRDYLPQNDRLDRDAASTPR